MKNNLFAYLSIFATLITLTSCGGDNKPQSETSGSINDSSEERREEQQELVPDSEISQAITENYIEFGDEHLATNTMHKGIDTVTYAEKTIVFEGKTTYSIIHDGSDGAVKIAGKLKSDFSSLFKIFIPVLSIDEIGGSVDENNDYIVFSTNSEMFASIFPDKNDIKDYGYGIKSKANSLFVLSYGNEGMDNAYNPLAKVLFGYEPLFDLDVYNYRNEKLTSDSTIYLPICDIVETPDFLHRCRGQTLSTSIIRKMNNEMPYDFYYPIGNGSPHNAIQLLPYSKYGSTHSNWYASNHKQLCYTAHGNESEFKALVEEVGNYCFNVYHKNNENNSFMIGQTDTAGENADARLCECDSCTSIMNKYKDPSAPSQKPHSALMIRFFNAVDDYIHEQYKVDDIKLIFFAYQDSMIPPYDSENSLRTNKNVGVYCAPSRASYTHSFYDEMQKDMEKDYPKICRDWSKKTDSLYLWMYQTQFKSVLFPFQSWSSTIDNCRFAHECNGVSIFPEGDEFNTNMTSFGRFKDFLYSKGMYNVNSNYSELKRIYFDNYYGSAGSIMETLYDQIVSYLTYLATKENGVYKGLITEPGYNQKSYWNKSLLQQWSAMVDEALKTIDKNRYSDAENYEKYKAHVETEGVFPLFALLTLFKNEFDSVTFTEMASKLAKWCREYGIQYESESDKSTNDSLEKKYFKGWGV